LKSDTYWYEVILVLCKYMCRPHRSIARQFYYLLLLPANAKVPALQHTQVIHQRRFGCCLSGLLQGRYR